MAWSHVANRGTAQNKTSSATFSISPTATISPGAILVLWVAMDNNNNSTITGPVGDQLIVEDTAGNAWAKVFEAQDASSNNRCQACLAVCQVKNQLTTSHSIVVSHALSNRVAKAMSLEEFSLPDGQVWSTSGRAIHRHDRGVDPGGISFGTIPLTEHLLLHLLAGEGPDTDAYTWDSDYTQITGTGTTGGADESNMHIRGGYRIATVTGDTVDVTSDTADRDYTQGVVALLAFTSGEFPETSVLDDFNRANESPLGGGWNVGCRSTLSPNNNLQVTSNQAATTGSGTNGQLWSTIFTTIDQDAWATIATPPGAAGHIGVLTNGPDSGITHACNTVSADCQAVIWRVGDGDGVPPARLFLTRGGGGGVVETACHIVVYGVGNPSAGYKLGLRRRSGINEIWWDKGSGWEYAGVAYYDNQFSQGRLGLVFTDSGTRADDFGGGIPSPAFVPQIIRRTFS